MGEKACGDAEFVMQSAGRCEDFIAMYAARNLVISVSTFAWWAGFLGRGEFEKRVFYPYHAQVPLLHPARMRRWFNRLLPTCESESRFHAVEYTSRRPSLLRKQLGGLMRPVRSVGNLQLMAAKASPKAGMPRSKSHQHLAGRLASPLQAYCFSTRFLGRCYEAQRSLLCSSSPGFDSWRLSNLDHFLQLHSTYLCSIPMDNVRLCVRVTACYRTHAVKIGNGTGFTTETCRYTATLLHAILYVNEICTDILYYKIHFVK